MVMETDGSMSQVEYEAHIAAERARKNKVVIARLFDLSRQPEMTEPETAARYDLVTFWIPQIGKAIERGKTQVTNHSSWFTSRSAPEYISALRVLLGDEFEINCDEDLWRNRYTKVSW